MAETMSNIVNMTQPAIMLFKGENYKSWSIKMSTLFKSQCLWDLVDKGAPHPNEQENQRKDTRALFFIQQAIRDTIFSKISAATTFKDAWTTLKTTFQGSARVMAIKLQGLCRDIKRHMQIDESVQIFPSRVTSIVNQIHTYGDNMSEQTMVAEIGESYLSTYSFLELMESLQTHKAKSRTEAKGDQKVFYRKGESSPGRGGRFHCRFGEFLFQHGIKMSSASTAKDKEMYKLTVSEKRGKNNKHAMQKKTKSDPHFSWCIQKVKRKDPQPLKKQQKMKIGIKHCKKYYW